MVRLVVSVFGSVVLILDGTVDSVTEFFFCCAERYRHKQRCKNHKSLAFGKKKKSLELKQSVKYLSFPKTSTNRWASKHGQATFGVDRALVHVLFRLGKLSSILGL